MNNPIFQTAKDDNKKTLPDLFTREPYLLEEMTLEQFEQQFILLDNDEISIDDVDLNPPRVTV